MFDGVSASGFAASICAVEGASLSTGFDRATPFANTKDSGMKGSNSTKSVLKIKFTEEEDVKLHRLVMQFGTKDWIKISQLMETRNPRQCRERWNNYVNPALRTDPWTPEEDMILDQKYAEYGPKWNKISKFFVNRSDNNIRNRWMMLARHRAKQQKSPVSPPPTPAPVKPHPFEVPQIFMPVVREIKMAEKQPSQNSLELLGEEKEPAFELFDPNYSLDFESEWKEFSYL